MAVLKKLKASTLMETLVASVLIVVVFMVASMVLNQIFSNTVKHNNRAIKTHINELMYHYKNGKIALPYHDDFKMWQIAIDTYKEQDETVVRFEVTNRETQKQFSKTCYGKQ